MRVKPLVRIGMTLLGIAMVVGAFVGVLALGINTNQPPLYIAVARHDLAPGDHLHRDDVQIVDQILDPRLADLYVQERDLAAFEGALIVDPLRTGDPLSKVKFVGDDPSAVTSRYALSLKDPNDVIMTLPVNPDIIPGRIRAGDYVNILLATSDGGLSNLPQPASTEAAPAELPPTGPDIAPSRQLPSAARATPAADDLALPLSDLMLERVLVLDVNYAADSASQPDAAPASISSIVVRVPRSHQTLLAFGASTSKLRYALTSPALGAQDVQPQLGMDWAAYIAAYRWKQAQVLARGETLTQTLYPRAINAALTSAPQASSSAGQSPAK